MTPFLLFILLFLSPEATLARPASDYMVDCVDPRTAILAAQAEAAVKVGEAAVDRIWLSEANNECLAGKQALKENLDVLAYASKAPFEYPFAEREESWIQTTLQLAEGNLLKLPIAEVCDRYDRFAELENFLRRIDERQEAMRSIFWDNKNANILRQELMIADAIERSGSFVKCMNQYEFASVKETELGLRLCGKLEQVSAPLSTALNAIANENQSLALGWSCLVTGKNRPKFATKNLREGRKILAALEGGIEKELATHKSQAQNQLTRLLNLKERFSPVQAACEQKAKVQTAEWEKKVRLVRVDGFRTGSGYFVRNQRGQADFVTAKHVPFEHDSEATQKSAQISLRPLEGKDRRRLGLSFTQAPENYDLPNDTVKNNAGEQSTAFEAIPAGKLPEKIGQEFTLVGFPTNGGESISHLRCTFVGLTTGLLQPEEPAFGYALHCPAAVSHIRGMSGGAMVGEDGKVWGTISGHAEYENIVLVMPLGRKENGENVAGFQSSFRYPHCLDQYNFVKAPFPCDIKPAQFLPSPGSN